MEVEEALVEEGVTVAVEELLEGAAVEVVMVVMVVEEEDLVAQEVGRVVAVAADRYTIRT